MKLSIITPEKILYKDNEIKRITLPTIDGEVTILQGHTAVVTFLAPGEATVEDDKGVRPLVLSGGFIEVSENKVKILADAAESVEELDVDRAEQARKRAEELLKQKHVSSEEFASLTAKIEKELVRIKVGKKYRKIKSLK